MRTAGKIERVTRIVPVHRTYKLYASNSEENLYPGQRQADSFYMILSGVMLHGSYADGTEQEPAKSISYNKNAQETVTCEPEQIDVRC